MKLNRMLPVKSTIKIDSIMTDSRIKSKNGIFFCIKGLTVDGHHYVEQAIKNGAVVIIHSDPVSRVEGIIYHQVNDVYQTYSLVAHRFYNDPSSKLKMIAITGTNGKTTIASTIQSLSNHFFLTGNIGTNGIDFNKLHYDTDYSTPMLHETLYYLEQMVQANCVACAMETTSQGLAQKRVLGIDFDYAIYTNLSHDHLDYHKTFDHYKQSKKSLFDELKNDAVAIINSDDPYAFEMVSDTKAKVITVARDREADFRAINIEYMLTGTTFDCLYNGDIYPIKTNLMASFNVYNVLSVIALFVEMGITIHSLIDHLKTIEQIPGRLNFFRSLNDVTVIVDYAHTPDGFEQLFGFIDSIKSNGRIISVFGSAGQRDKQKRPILGQIASSYSDVIVLTEEDNRNETPLQIANEIKEGIKNTEVYFKEDRFDAIELAYKLATQGDILLILGKGSENFLARKNGKEQWMSDNTAVERLISETF